MIFSGVGGMFMLMQRLARAVIRRRRVVLVITALSFPIAGIFGAPVAAHLSAGGLTVPGAESSRAAARLNGAFNAGEANFLLMVTVKRGTVDSPEVAARGAALTNELGHQPGLQGAVSYWTLNNAP